MRVHWLQHAEHEELGCIAPWLKERRFRVSRTRLFDGERLPAPGSFDWLVVMGGPMNIYEHRRHPWLLAEKEFINDAIVMNKLVLGICLGAQLIADVLDGKVTRNQNTEIGFFDVFTDADSGFSTHLSGVPRRFQAFHWHGDTFSIPPGATRQYKSDACVNQSFSWGARVLALQFHLEVTHADARRWLALEVLRPQAFVQSNRRILQQSAKFAANNRLMTRILERLAK